MRDRFLEPFRRQPLAADATLAVVMFALALALNDVGYETGPAYPWVSLPRYSVAVAAVALTMLPLAVRRRTPIVALALGIAGLALLRLLYVPEYQLSSIALFFYLYSVGRWGDARWRNPARTVATLAVLAVLARGLYAERRFFEEGIISGRAYAIASVVGVLGNLVFIVAPWVLGNVTRVRAERERDLAVANAELLESRAEAERRAVSDERVRIARELHDVVAHHVSVMGVQAGAARRLLETSPEAATGALTDIEASSRQAVAELQRLLGFLRTTEADGDDGLVALPAPSLLQLSTLQRQTAAAGMAVSLTIEGERPPGLAASIDVSGYRIVQEALTNALKHSGQHEAEVLLVYSTESVRVSIRNGGSGVGPVSTSGGGNGLIGMHERVALHGGELTFGPTSDGGFEVDAELPLRGAPQQMELQP